MIVATMTPVLIIDVLQIHVVYRHVILVLSHYLYINS
jgi:hypothetical protein